MISRRTALGAAAGAAMLNILPTTGWAADAFPSKPLEVIIPFAPGDTDNMLRPFSEKLSEFLGQPLVLNFRSGAAGGVGASYVARSKPDGYTLVGTSQSSIVVVPLANEELKYTPDSFAPVVSLSEGGLILVVASSSPWKSLQDLVEYSKKSPKALNYSSSGSLGITHLLAEMFSREAGIEWTHIPMQGTGPAITALLGGHIQMASAAIAPALAHIKAGTLRALAMFGEQRLKVLPDVPTLKELGYKTASPILYGLSAPKGTPKAVVDAIYGAAKKAVDKYGTQIESNLAIFGGQINLQGPDEYAAYLKHQYELFAAGIKGLR